MKICVLAQKSANIIKSIPDRDSKPKVYWIKRIIVSVIVSFVMSAIVIPRLSFYQSEQDNSSSAYEAGQMEFYQNTTSSDTEGSSISQIVSELYSNNSAEPIEARTVLTGTTNGISWEYIGNVLDGVPHGQGVKDLENGSQFYGEWSHGRFMNGSGMEVSESGHFVGSFVNGFWSEGILQMQSGTTYEGTFTHRDGRHYRHGQGRISFANGDIYEGGFRYDQRHGQGTAFHAATGSTQSGVWINNDLQ
jgi:hypothetical protein